MPWSGDTFSRTNGTHTGTTVWAQDAAAGDKILSGRHDTHDQDLSDGINACLKKDGGNSPTANIPMNSHKFTGMAVGTASTDSARYGQTITAASLNPATNILTLTRADGNITVDLTAIVVGGSFGNLCDKTINETVTGSWTFQNETIVNGFFSLMNSTLRWIFDGGDTYLKIMLEASGPGIHIDATTDSFFFVDSSGIEYTVYSAKNFNPASKSDVGHTHTLGELSNVSVPSPTDGDVLQWKSSSNAWTATAISAITGVVRSVAATAPLTATGTLDITIACPVATTSASGLMSAADKTKLDGLSATQVTSYTGNQGSSRSGAVTAATGDYDVTQVARIYVQNGTPSTAGSDGALWFKNGGGSSLNSVRVLVSGAWRQITADYDSPT